jgi:hypothetical protein
LILTRIDDDAVDQNFAAVEWFPTFIMPPTFRQGKSPNSILISQALPRIWV